MDYFLAEQLLVIHLAEKFHAFMEPEPAPKPFSHDRHVEVQSLF
jgi:hypothetical protein